MLYSTPVQRYVVRAGGEYSVDDDGIRVGSAWWLPSDPQRNVADLEDGTSFALLGEPGVGKTTTLVGLASGVDATYVPLDEATDVTALEALLAPAATGATTPHTLVLDGVDECPLPPKTLIRRVVGALARASGIRVLVGCRTADWPARLGEELAATLGSFEVLELLPFSREDIRALCEERGVDGTHFLAAVRGAGVGPLATLPLTLDLLLELYAVDGSLPDDGIGLYERGLLRLSGEPDPDRAYPGRGTDAQRLSVACRIAAALTLCGRSAVSINPIPMAGDLPVGALVGGTEPLPAGEAEVTAGQVTAALATALFSSRGPGRLGVAHASFAAYLTARYLHTHEVPEHQLRALLTRTSSLGRTSVPNQLRETAAWLVAFDSSANMWLVELDPMSLAAYSPLVNEPEVRATIVRHLLDADASNPEVRASVHRWRLAHPALGDQLRPALRAPLTEDAGPHFGHPVSRRAGTAVDIARRSGAVQLVQEVAGLAASPDLNPYLRSSAARALIDLDPDQATPLLREVLEEVMEHPAHDPQDDLRGLALETCWPTAVTPAELLAALTSPQDKDYIGPYKLFLGHFAEHLSDDSVEALIRAIPAALNSSEPDGRPTHLLRARNREGARLLTQLLERALAHPRLGTLVDPVGRLLAHSLDGHEAGRLPPVLAGASLHDEPEDGRRLRHALVLSVLTHIPARRTPLLLRRWSGDGHATASGAGGGVGLVTGEDLEWLFSLADGDFQQHAAVLIRTVYNPDDQDQQEMAWTHRDSSLVADSIGHWFEAVQLDGPVAEQMREEYEFMHLSPATWPGASGHPDAVTEAWALCRAGDLGACSRLWRLLRTYPLTGRSDWFDTDVSNWPSMGLLEPDPEELADVARRYLIAIGPTPGDWLESAGVIAEDALSGYALLGYLGRRPDAEAWFDRLPTEVWSRWAPAVIRSPIMGDDRAHEGHRLLLGQLARRLPERFVHDYITWIEHAVTAGWSLPDLGPLTSGFDTVAGDRLFALLPRFLEEMDTAARDLLDLGDDPDVDARRAKVTERLERARDNAARLSGLLCAHNHRPTLTLLKAVMASAALSTNHATPVTRAVAAQVLLVGEVVKWDDLVGQTTDDEAFGRALAVELAQSVEGGSFFARLTDQQLGSLWAWVHARWGGEGIATGFVGEAERVRRWRDDMLTELASRATPAALSVLAGLVEGNPGHSRLGVLLHEAEARQRDDAWAGPTFDELMALVGDARRTIVHDDDALYRLVLASLERFSARLQDVGQALWNETRSADEDAPRMVWRPKYEPDVSALLADHLRQELADRLVVNREVLVRQTTSKGHGLSVDVLPSGGIAGPDTGRLPQCPVEVKGCWNRGLFTDLEAQLVDDYLSATGATRGVYVCAWFPPEQWDDLDDSRRATAASRVREEVMRSLEAAAERISAAREVTVTAVTVEVPRPMPSVRKLERP